MNTKSEILPDFFFDHRFDNAVQAANNNNTGECIAFIHEITVSQAEKHYEDALVLENKGNIDGTVTMLEKAVKANPGFTAGWLKLATLLPDNGAEKAYRTILKHEPNHVEAQLRLAFILISKNNHEEASSLLQKTSAHTYQVFEIQFALASSVWKLGDFALAENSLRHCIRLQPTDVRPYAILIDLFNRADRLDEVEKTAKEFLKFDSFNREIQEALFSVLVRRKKWAEAESVIQFLLEKDSCNIHLRQLYAEMLFLCNRQDEALAIHKKNIELAPNNPDTYIQLADIQHKMELKPEASQTCKLIRKLYSRQDGWGLNMIPFEALTRLIFSEIDTIASHYCTGERAIYDNTGINISRNIHSAGEIIELMTMVVGQGHLDYLEHAAYPSLFASEGFAKLQKERKIISNIYTTLPDYKNMGAFLKKLDNRGITYRINIELLSFTQDLYSILCLPIIDQVKRSLNLNSIVVTALPDTIVIGSLAKVIYDMKPRETVVCAMPRINAEKAFKDLRSHFISSTSSVDVRSFIKKCMTEYIHPQTYSALRSETNCLKYNDEGGFYSARNFAPPPLCFYAREEMLHHMLEKPMCAPTSMASFFAIDHDFVESAYQKGLLKIIDNSDYFFWAELTGLSSHTDFLSGRKSEGYYYPEVSHHIFNHPSKWIYES